MAEGARLELVWAVILSRGFKSLALRHLKNLQGNINSLYQWPVGQAVKTPPFHGGNTGSNPVRVTIYFNLILSRGGAVW